MGSRVQPTVGYFPALRFLDFFVVQVLVGLRKQFTDNFVFPAWACATGFNNNNIKIIYNEFIPTPRKDSHVKSDKTYTQSS